MDRPQPHSIHGILRRRFKEKYLQYENKDVLFRSRATTDEWDGYVLCVIAGIDDVQEATQCFTQRI